MPPGGPPDVLIVESTFGVTNIASREKREIDFTNTVESIVRRGGSCLIPVFALGRAQELLLILDEYWKDNVDLQVCEVKLCCLCDYESLCFMLCTKLTHISDILFPLVRTSRCSTRPSWRPSLCGCTRPSST